MSKKYYEELKEICPDNVFGYENPETKEVVSVIVSKNVYYITDESTQHVSIEHVDFLKFTPLE